MEVVKHHHQDHNPCLSLSTGSKFQRRTIQIIALVSIFFGMLLFRFSSLIVPLCFRFFQSFHFSAYFVELQSLSTNKIYMFLLCNGILVILVGSSSLTETGRYGITPSGPQAADKDPRFHGRGRDSSNEQTDKTRTTDAEEMLPVAVKEEFSIQKDEIQEQGRELAITVVSHHDDEFEDQLSRDECMITEQTMQEQPSELWMITDQAVIDDNDNGNDDKADGELSIEEFNSKCDEFIKKMKGEL